ncbi:hypothetical protein C9994_07930 [Marivirga lumbricoides]|uniref:Uncharacterized protein n=1 Tax=Marivirga lumbricoides TaxID=1046115 RepID=A0A2T4DR71_9BACT|nr:hypothetical protein C9994_07930 [Marivirga lumbricoides]
MPFDKESAIEAAKKSSRKGVPNKATSELREKISTILTDQWENVLSDLQSLSPKDRIDVWLRLLEYSIPKLQRNEIIDATTIEAMAMMTPEQRRIEILKLKSQINNK